MYCITHPDPIKDLVFSILPEYGIMRVMSWTSFYVKLNIILLFFAACLAVLFLYNENIIKGKAEKAAHEQQIRIELAQSEARLSMDEWADSMTSAVKTAYDDLYPPQTEEGAERGIAILMYHTVYDPLDPPRGVNNNYISTTNLEEQLKYLTDEGYSFPTWKEVRRYIDGEIDLPEKSVVLTFDDGTDGFRKYGVPLLNKYKVPATVFIIGSRNGEKWAANRDDYPYLDLESHSYDMHRPGGRIGHGGVMTALSEEEIYDDLKKSQEVIGCDQAFAYPFGDVDDLGKCRTAVEEAGFVAAVTTKLGKAHPGDDPLLLPRNRVLRRNTLTAFISLL